MFLSCFIRAFSVYNIGRFKESEANRVQLFTACPVRLFLFGGGFMFVFFNPNPARNLVGDCVVRGISKITNKTWDDVYLGIVMQGFYDKDMPSSNAIWDNYLRNIGYDKFIIPNTCPNCYTVNDFAEDHPTGQYLLATGTHVVAVVDGDYYDTWDSGAVTPIYYYTKQEVDDGL